MKGHIKYIIALVVILGTAFGVRAADLDDLYQKKDQLQEKLDQAQSAAENKSAEINSLSSQISSLEDDIASTEQKIANTSSQIEETSGTISGLESDIKKKNEELAQMKKKINAAIVEIYRFSSRSDWELVLGSESLSESSNQSKYVETIQIQVKASYDKLTELKNELDEQKRQQEEKKKELDELKARQEEYRQGAQYQMSQKDKLLNMTAQQKEEYEQMASKLKSEITHISAEIYAERQRRLSGSRESLVGGGSGYPYSAIDVPDAWGFLTRECTSYAAWYWNVVLGKSWVNTRPGSGSAYNWPNLARDQGYTVSSTPRRGAIISWSAGSLTSAWGHVAIVEEVNGDGTIDLSEYNWIKYSYSYRSNVDPYSYGDHSYIY